MEIDSDYELSRVLRNAAGSYVIDATMRATFFQAVNSIESDYEQGRILADLLQQRDLSTAMAQDVLESAMTIDSDHELSTILRGAASRFVLDETLRPIFFRAVGSLSSDYERRRVLQQVTQANDVSRAVLLDAINVISDLGSDYEKATLLMDLGRRYRNDDEIRDAIMEIADTLGFAYLKVSLPEAALVQFDEAARLAEAPAEAWQLAEVHRGMALIRLGREQEARQALEAVIAVNGEQAGPAQKLLQELEQG